MKTLVKLFRIAAFVAVIVFSMSACNDGSIYQIPAASHYTFGNMTQITGNVTAVTITRNSNASPGAVSNIRYNGSITIPQTEGTYVVTFNVAAAAGWDSATLFSGVLVVNPAASMVIFSFKDDVLAGLTVGTKFVGGDAFATIFEEFGIIPAGNFDGEIVTVNGANALQITTKAGWGEGIDFLHERFAFQQGDRITLRGSLVRRGGTGSYVQFLNNITADPVWIHIDVSAYTMIRTLAAADMTAILDMTPSHHSPNLQSVRIGGTEIGTVFIITDFIIERTAEGSDADNSAGSFLGATLNLSGQVWNRNPNNNFFAPYSGSHIVSAFDIDGINAGGSGSITNGQLSFSIGTPNNTVMRDIADIFGEGVLFDNSIISNHDARGASILPGTTEGRNILSRGRISSSLQETVYFVYVDADVTITGIGRALETGYENEYIPMPLHLDLKEGWNVILARYDEMGPTFSTANPSNLRWFFLW